ncbi:MAG: flavin reductase family protein [Planctomycetota bacterium]
MPEFDPQQLSITERYKLLIGSVVPRPIGFISTISPSGAHNVAPYSFFNAVGSNPMTMLFCPANDGRGAEKDSLRNARLEANGGTGEFVVNVATEEIIRQVVASSEPLPPEESEFDLTGLTPAPCRVVKAPRVAESAVSFECRTTRIIQTNPGAPAGGNLVLGEVVHVWVREGLVNERMHVHPGALAAVGRMGGQGYATTRERFELPSSKEALVRTKNSDL